MKSIRVLALVLVLLLLLWGLVRGEASDSVDWWVMASGGGPLGASGQVALDATLGQPVTGPSQAGGITLGGGYWYGMRAGGYLAYLPVVLRAGP